MEKKAALPFCLGNKHVFGMTLGEYILAEFSI